MTPEQISELVAAIGENFRTFGGDREPGNNPIAHAMKGKALAFAANVSVEDVARFVVAVAERVTLERAAKAAERHVASSPSAAGELAMRRNGEDIAAAIRALAAAESDDG
jgi:hypothetical protein